MLSHFLASIEKNELDPILASAIWILLMGFFSGELARRLRLPPLVGMILVGIGIGPQLGDLISPEILNAADSLRLVAVMVILMKAGLGLDREKLFQQGSVALRLSFLPAAVEAIVVAGVAMWLFEFDLMTGLLLGCVVGAESPAVIVPGMLRLKSLGRGVAKGIPDVILTGCAVSDILMLSVFSLLLSFLAQGRTGATNLFGVSMSPELMLIPQVGLQIVLGMAIGFLGARILEVLLKVQDWTHNVTQKMIIAGSIALALVVAPNIFPYYSGYLAVATMGLFLVKFDMPLARILRGGFDVMWIIAEIVLFVLLGATVQLEVLGDIVLRGLLLLAIGILVGRSIGLWLSSYGSNWTRREKWFLLPGTMAKATVQAAIGALPLAVGIEGGDIILAIAALSILTTAPIGAWLIQILAPKWLQEDEVDPTKVAISDSPTFLMVINTPSHITPPVLQKAADLARRSNGKIVVISSFKGNSEKHRRKLEEHCNRILADIERELEDPFPFEPLHTLFDRIHEKYKTGYNYIIIGSQDPIREDVLKGSSPVILVPQ